MNNYFEHLKSLEINRKKYVVITLVKVVGSSPQDLGAKAVVTMDGLSFGTIGGGKVEAFAIKHAMNMLAGNSNFELHEWNLQKDIGMTCGGVVSLLFEKTAFENNFKIAVFGAGHVALEVVRTLSHLACDIICIDPRIEWLDKIRTTPSIKKIQTDNMASVIDELSDDYFIVSLTMGHAFDRPILEKALRRNFKFVGVIGSDQKAKVLRHELSELDKLDPKNIEKLHCPIGLELGTNHPSEIAISIAAQLLKYRDL